MSLKTNYRDGDFFTRRSKREGYRSRASYKLKEILKKDIKPKKGCSILDLGSYPGGWSQVAIEFSSKSGLVVAIDIQPMEKIDGCFFLQKSVEAVTDEDFVSIKKFLPFDLVLSDMAPN